MLVGGARGGDNLASIEAVTIDKATGKIVEMARRDGTPAGEE
ncbi:MAG TPA: hypothetical protein VFE62_30335 [Gemmataceae bacterium]|nr:hypothetical protein [Pirellulales bacterium]HZZ82837.1 hypothetical protein [Gemmataceae bacterium]